MKLQTLVDTDLKGKRVLMRVDMNVPLKKGEISDDSRIRASLPSIVHILKSGAALILMSHLGRPIEGKPSTQDSLVPIAAHLSALINKPVPVMSDWRNGFPLALGNVVMLENVRLNPGELSNSEELGRDYARLADIFVNDAFGCAHRAEASTHAVARFAPVAVAGMLLTEELNALSKALEHPARPLIAIVAGSKVSTKLTILETLSDKVDQLIVGGGIANTFLLAQGYTIGQSLAEPELVGAARRIIAKLNERGAHLPLPIDVMTAEKVCETAKATCKLVSDVTPHDRILDIGPQSRDTLATIMATAGTIVWNGPVGMFELEAFSHGTRALAHAIAKASAFSIAGGGDTLAAMAQFGITEKIGYISTGGGAFLEYLEGKPLPAVTILEERAANTSRVK